MLVSMLRPAVAWFVLLAFAGTAAGEGLLIVNNDTLEHALVYIQRSRPVAGRRWTVVEVPSGKQASVRLVSQDTFNLRIFIYRPDGSILELGADRVDLHAVSDTPGGGEYAMKLRHWSTTEGGQKFDAWPYPVEREVRLKGGGGVVTMDLGGLVGHKPIGPIILP